MKFELLIYLVLGGTLGVLLRSFIIKNYYNIGLTIDNVSIVNLISSLLMGVYIALDISGNKISLFFLIGFLGCFSTFSSFIFNLFKLLKEKKYILFVQHYIEIIFYSSLMVFIGYLTTKIILT
ncbi:MAG: chromosome condensation protein CrcB [Prochlorococcus sp. SP3034]|nr:chromosome condensation protein CrcB [Prochlorococcus sp. SP3034]